MDSLTTSLSQRTALLLMSGSGTRFGSCTPKQFHRLAGKKIYLYTLEALLSSNFFHEILLVTHPDWIKEVEVDLQDYPIDSCRIVAGGATRQESSFLGLLACHPGTKIILVHDAVRPFVSKDILYKNLLKAEVVGAVDTCISSADTLVYAPEKNHIAKIPPRADFFRGQTPQTFQYSILHQAHLHAKSHQLEGISDDCRLVCEIGAPVAIVEGADENIKITTELDLLLAQQMLAYGRGTSEAFTASLWDLKDRPIAVTGAHGDIGSAICRKLQEEGARVIPIVHSKGVYTVDLESAQEIERCFETIYQQEGLLDGLITCAGILNRKKLSDQKVFEIDNLLDVNLRSVILCCKYARMQENGHIINVASSSYTKGRKDIAVYAATKAAVVNFSQGLAEERPDLNVDVVSPQRTNTSMRRACFPNDDPNSLLNVDEVARDIVRMLQQKRRSHAAIDIRKK